MAHTLLLADDSVTIQRVIALTFADEDIEVVTVSDGDQAIELIDTSPPDIVLADVGMPNRNGYEVAQHIKQSPELSHIPVVLLTGALEPVDESRAIEAGCDAVLVKPFDPQQVIARVKELLGRTARHDELDRYFDRLDHELTSLVSAGREAASDHRSESVSLVHVPQPTVDAPANRAVPPLADAFAALLEAEQQEPVDFPPLTWSTAPPKLAARVANVPNIPNIPVIPEINEEMLEEITQRVLLRLSDKIVREAVDDIVSRVAERLVREEIERIKSSIK